MFSIGGRTDLGASNDRNAGETMTSSQYERLLRAASSRKTEPSPSRITLTLARLASLHGSGLGDPASDPCAP